MKDIAMFNCIDCEKFTYVDSDEIETAKHLSCAFCNSERLEKFEEYDLKRD